MKTVDSSPGEQDAALNELLVSESPRRSWSRRLLLIGAMVVLVALGLVLLRRGERPAGPRYETEPATTGKLVVKVSATGNLKPTNNVDVGSELSGIVTEVLVDENDRVHKGQVLAQLDLSKLKDAVTSARATLAAARAQVLQAQATVMEARAKLARFKKVAELSGGKEPSRAEMVAAEADVKRAEASEASARAAVSQASATLQSDRTNLRKASIRSPINGVVLTRSVEPGQTVAAALQAPVLFTLAEDLAKMELQVDIDEADVGQVKVGQRATFTVDAWPGRKYTGVITRVGFGSQLKDGVVSYPAVIAVRNDDLSLRPGMTGVAEIVTLTREDALLVPNAALRYTPSAAHRGPPRRRRGGGLLGKLMPHPPHRGSKAQAPRRGGRPAVWVLRGGRPVPVEVQTGATNGRVTEVLGGELKPGAELITEELRDRP